MYRNKVKTQSLRNPSLTGLYEFLAQPASAEDVGRIVSLDFFSSQSRPSIRKILSADLDLEFRNEESARAGLLGQILIVEDICNDNIEKLGAILYIDPFFFASYIHQPWRSRTNISPQNGTLPSREKVHNFLPLYYHRSVVLQNLDEKVVQLKRNCNQQRKVFVLPSKADRVGLAQHCNAIIKLERPNGRWLCKKDNFLGCDAFLTLSRYYTC
jgi:hypothetical protein